MQRHARRITICLVLGVLTTIAVAWCLAIRVVVNIPGREWVNRQGLYVPAVGDRAWWCQVFERTGLTVVAWEAGRVDSTVTPTFDVKTGMIDRPYRRAWVFTGPGRTQMRVVRSHLDETTVPRWARRLPLGEQADAAGPPALQAFSARGWPLRAVWYHAVMGPPARVNRGGIEMPRTLSYLGPGPVLPYRPIVLGLAANTVFYGVIWFGITATPGIIRRAQRSRDGRCPECGYDLRGAVHDRCPECGEAGETRARFPRPRRSSWSAPRPSSNPSVMLRRRES